MKPIQQHTGFTLVEVILAITIFALAMTTLFATFNTVISGVDPMKAGMNDYETAQNALDRIQKDLLSLCLTHDPAYLPLRIEESNTSDPLKFVAETASLNEVSYSHLRFASFEHLGFDPKDFNRIGIINYYVVAEEDGSHVLKRSDVGLIFHDITQNNNQGIDPIKDPVLCDRIKAFDLKFIDQEGSIHDNWDSDSADSGTGTPMAVKISLEIGDKDRSDHFETTILLPTLRVKNES